MMKVVVNGAMGRMGRMIVEEIRKQDDLEISGLIEAPGSPLVGSYLDEVMGSGYEHVIISNGSNNFSAAADVLIDFSLPEGTMMILDNLEQSGTPLVCGTTGFSEEEEGRLREVSEKIPVFYSTNFSPGMYLLTCALRDIAGRLPSDWDVELVEAHHRMKKDAPSGTALGLAKILAGHTRTAVHSLRVGDVPGRHSLVFAGTGEVVELSHSVHSRIAFASGSLAAARFIEGKEAGWYGMDDLYREKK